MATKNNSGLKPVGISVLVLPEQIEQESESGIIIATDGHLERLQMKQTDAEVIEISDYAYHDEPHPRCKVGDRIIMAAFAGMVRKGVDGLDYRLIRDNDVIGILNKEPDDKKVKKSKEYTEEEKRLAIEEVERKRLEKGLNSFILEKGKEDV